MSINTEFVGYLVEAAKKAIESGSIDEVNTLLNDLSPLAPLLGRMLLMSAIDAPHNGIPLAWFHGMAPAFPQASPEFIVYFKKDGKILVPLLRRPGLDTNPLEEWPNQLHSPGTTLRPGDLSPSKDMKRRNLAEFGGEDAILEITLFEVHYTNHLQRARGACAHILCAVEIDPDVWLKGGPPKQNIEIYELGEIPMGEVVDHHRTFLGIFMEELPALLTD